MAESSIILAKHFPFSQLHVPGFQIWENYYVWKLATCSCDNGKYLASIMDDSDIMCEEIIEEEIKTVTTNSNVKIQSVKQKNIYIFYLLFY